MSVIRGHWSTIGVVMGWITLLGVLLLLLSILVMLLAIPLGPEGGAGFVVAGIGISIAYVGLYFLVASFVVLGAVFALDLAINFATNALSGGWTAAWAGLGADWAANLLRLKQGFARVMAPVKAKVVRFVTWVKSFF